MFDYQIDSSKPHLLYLVHRMPYPPDKGDRIRAFQVLRYLSQKAHVHVACLADEPVKPEAFDKLRSHCARLAVVNLGRFRWVRALGTMAMGRTISEGAFSSPKLRSIIKRWTTERRFHACVSSASSMVPYLQLPELRDIPTVVDLVDVDSEKWLNYAATRRGFRALVYGLEGKRLRRLEAELPVRTRAVTLVSTAETELYQQFCAAGRVQTVMNGVDLDYFRPRQPQPEEVGCVFVGALDYRPNVEGISWFCHEVWPKVLLSRPQAKLHLVGRRPTFAVRRLAQRPGVTLVGQVADVRPYLNRAAIAIAPLHVARGVQNKILESLAMGKATVISSECMNGLHAKPGTHLLVATSAADWTQKIVSLLGDSAMRDHLGQAGREYVAKYHRWERCLAPLDTLLGLPSSSVSQLPPSADRSPLPFATGAETAS